MKTWIFVADACGGRVFETSDAGKTLHLLRRFSHAQGRAMEADLTADRPGSSYSDAHRGTSTMEPHKVRKEVEATQFARGLAEHLHLASQRGEVKAIVLVVPPHFLGMLRNAVSGDGAAGYRIARQGPDLHERRIDSGARGRGCVAGALT